MDPRLIFNLIFGGGVIVGWIVFLFDIIDLPLIAIMVLFLLTMAFLLSLLRSRKGGLNSYQSESGYDITDRWI